MRLDTGGKVIPMDMEETMKQIEDAYAGFEAGFKQAHEDIDGAEKLLAIVADMKNDLTPLNNYFVYEKLA